MDTWRGQAYSKKVSFTSEFSFFFAEKELCGIEVGLSPFSVPFLRFDRFLRFHGRSPEEIVTGLGNDLNSLMIVTEPFVISGAKILD